MTPSLALFWLLAIISVAAAILMVSNKNPVRSALYLVLTFICVAVFYITLSAQFIAAVQIIVYAGAIMVLFLFVIMLLNLGAPTEKKEERSVQPIIALGLGVVFFVLLMFSRSLVDVQSTNIPQKTVDGMGTVEAVGLALYSPKLPWLFPFELTSVLLLVAVVGAIILAKRKI